MDKTRSVKSKKLSTAKTQASTSSERKRKSSSKLPEKTPVLKPDILEKNPIDLKEKRANLSSRAEETIDFFFFRKVLFFDNIQKLETLKYCNFTRPKKMEKSKVL
ncbi:hypothetical protein PanWU01x14_302480 [Parasponia andersonii]|uniref:Uncharacterized protein n=1 Tax=Parasponia andersonii TaxID=3476 RepID=A0A2P5ATD0_PARAD|nr:hypothetical protein PanWU01x14_302480 [Parasponia andersonii]